MDIVVRTPHGDADVSIITHERGTTLGDVIVAITGQAIPRLAVVDGRAVDATTPLDDVGLLLGSLVETEPALPTVTPDTAIDIVQIAGHGAGRVTQLVPGRYRIGPGRRTSADELTLAPVEQPAFEIVVEPTPSSSETTIVPTDSEIALDGNPVTSSTSWQSGTLTAGSRAFQLDAPARSERPRSLSVPDSDGTVAFSRPPRRRSAPARRPIVDAVRDATLASPSLWERRPDHPDAYVLPFGWVTSESAVVSIDFGVDRAIAVSGSERFRSALARTLVVEGVTLHGPADLDLVVLTSRDRVAEWDWAKWLPHLRLDGPPAILSSTDDITRWAHAFARRAVSAATRWKASHLTMVVVDDPSLWNQREAPLRSIVSNPPNDMRLVALCEDAAHAPDICTAVIAETAGGLAQLHSFTRNDDVDDVQAALTETAVAAHVARSLAPLSDVDLRAVAASVRTGDERVDLTEFIDVANEGEILQRWASDHPRSSVTIGHRDHDRIDVTVADDVTVVVGPSIGDAFDVAATSLLGQCTDRSPDALWVVPLMVGDTARSDLVWRLPHAADRHALDHPVDPGRLLARTRAVLDDPDGPERILLVVEAGGLSPATADAQLLASLVEGSRSMRGLAILVFSDRSDGPLPTGDTLIRVERRNVTGAAHRNRSATITIDGGAAGATFAPLQPGGASIGALELRPNVVGRVLTPLERRIEQERSSWANTPDPMFGPAIQSLRVAALQRDIGRSPSPQGGRVVVPPSLPTRVDLDELFSSSPGDGVPLGLVDDPSTADVRPRWWEPGHGSLLLFGSRRSGVEQVLSTITLGVIDRFAPDDVRLVVIEPSSARRRALIGIEGVRVVPSDRADDIAAALDEIEIELGRQASTGQPHMVVLIGDLVQLRRQFADQPLASRIDNVLVAAASAESKVDVIAYAGDLAGTGPFATTAVNRLVGAFSNREELMALGVEEPAELDGIVGRCRSFPGGDLVQLAMADVAAETLLTRRSTGGPT